MVTGGLKRASQHCLSGRLVGKHMTQSVQESARVAITQIWATDQHVKQFVKLSVIYLERGNLCKFLAKCFSNGYKKHKCFFFCKQTHYLGKLFLKKTFGSNLCGFGLYFI